MLLLFSISGLSLQIFRKDNIKKNKKKVRNRTQEIKKMIRFWILGFYSAGSPANIKFREAWKQSYFALVQNK